MKHMNQFILRFKEQINQHLQVENHVFVNSSPIILEKETEFDKISNISKADEEGYQQILNELQGMIDLE